MGLGYGSCRATGVTKLNASCPQTHALVAEFVVKTQFAAGELFDVGIPLTLHLSGILLVFSCCSFVYWSHIASATTLYAQLRPRDLIG